MGLAPSLGRPNATVWDSLSPASGSSFRTGWAIGGDRQIIFADLSNPSSAKRLRDAGYRANRVSWSGFVMMDGSGHLQKPIELACRPRTSVNRSSRQGGSDGLSVPT
jgi:hypothetical protein